MTDIRVFGGPTALIEFGGLRFLTDPTFDAPGDYPRGDGRFLTKTAPSTIDPADLGPIDVVLLSHDQHPDNLDRSGRELLARVPLVLTTESAAERLAGTARGLAPWESVQVKGVTVTAVPAQHGPEGCEPVTGQVIGFVLTGVGSPTTYVSGDNASLDVVREIARRFPVVDTAVIFAGGARAGLFDNGLLTLDSAQAAEAARILGANQVVPVHCDSWAHFTEGRDVIDRAFAAAGIGNKL